MSRSLVFLDQPGEIVKIFDTLLKKDDVVSTTTVRSNYFFSRSQTGKLLAFQIAFELVDNSTQKFRNQVIDGLPPVGSRLS